MPSFISNKGLWSPAHERAFDPKSGEIYDGPDREAKKYIDLEGGIVGKDALTDPELMQVSRNMGFKSVEDYLAYFQPSKKDIDAKLAADKKVVTHAMPSPQVSVDSVKGHKGGFYGDTDTPEGAMSRKKPA